MDCKLNDHAADLWVTALLSPGGQDWRFERNAGSIFREAVPKVQNYIYVDLDTVHTVAAISV
jgi:hypothetical protein